MRYAIIENDVIVNVIVADKKFIKDNNLNAVECDGFGVGDKYIDGEFISNQVRMPIDETLA